MSATGLSTFLVEQVISIGEPSIVIPVLTTSIGLVAVAVATRFERGRLVSPFSLVMLMLIAIFGIRPILMVGSSNYIFYYYNVAEGFNQAALAGLIAVLGISSGYWIASIVGRHSSGASSPAGITESPRVPRFRAAVLASLGLLILWLLLMVAIGGGIAFIGLMFAGRSDEVGLRFSGLPAFVPAIPVSAAVLIATARIAVERRAGLPRADKLVYWFVIALSVIPPSALGSRRFLIPSVVAGLIGALAPVWRKRVSLPMVLTAFGGFLVLAIFPFVRSAGSRAVGDSLVDAIGAYFEGEQLQGVLEGFFLSYDTEMFNYVAYLAPHLGNDLEWGLGRGTLGEALLAPIPAALLPFSSWSNVLLTEAFGGGCAEALCPVPSVVGVLFYDLSYPGVLVGGILIGILTSKFDRRFFTSNGISLIFLTGFASFAPLIARGNSISQIWIAIQSLAVVCIVWWLITVLSPQPAARREANRVLSEVASENGLSTRQSPL